MIFQVGPLDLHGKNGNPTVPTRTRWCFPTERCAFETGLLQCDRFVLNVLSKLALGFKETHGSPAEKTGIYTPLPHKQKTAGT